MLFWLLESSANSSFASPLLDCEATSVSICAKLEEAMFCEARRAASWFWLEMRRLPWFWLLESRLAVLFEFAMAVLFAMPATGGFWPRLEMGEADVRARRENRIVGSWYCILSD